MNDIKSLLEKISAMSAAEKKPTGPKFPGYWRGRDSVKLSRSKMVGSAQESILPEIIKQNKDYAVERQLWENYRQYQVEAYGNAQDPNAQVTSQSTQGKSPEERQKEQQAQRDQRIDVSTAKSMMSGLKTVLPPNLDPNQAAMGLVKMNDGQPLTADEQKAMGVLTPLVANAAEKPQTATMLKTALSTAAQLSKKGK